MIINQSGGNKMFGVRVQPEGKDYCLGYTTHKEGGNSVGIHFSTRAEAERILAEAKRKYRKAWIVGNENIGHYDSGAAMLTVCRGI
jgi:hypothetical protein